VGLRDSFARLPLTDRVTFAIELWASLFFGVFAGLALPLITVVARTIGMSAAAINAMVTAQFIGALFGFYLGHLANSTRAVMPLAVWPSLIGRAAIGLLAFVKTPGPYLLIVSLFYVLTNVNGPAYSSIMRSNYSDAHRSRIMGDIRIVVVVVSAVSSGAAGIILARNESVMRWLFLVAAAFGVASSAIFSRIKVRRGPAAALAVQRPSLLQSVKIIRGNAPFLVFLGLFFFCAGFDKLAIPLEPIWLVDGLRISYSDTSFMLGTVISLASIAAYFLWARALRRFNCFTLIAFNVVIFAARFAALAAARTSAQLLPMSILSGMCNAGWDLIPIFCMIALTGSQNFSVFMGLSTTLYGVRGLIGPSIGTLLYTSGAMSLDGILWMISGLLFLSSIGMFVFARKAGRRALEARKVATA
jgi:hypothetical protein